MMKKTLKKVSVLLKMVFGYGIMLCLFGGGMTFFGYVAALIIGGPVAAFICDFLYNRFFPIIIYTTSLLVLLGLAAMYLNGEMALTPKKK